MSKSLRHVQVAILALLCLSFLSSIGQSKKVKSKVYATQLRSLRSIVEKDIENIDKHNTFIDAWGIEDTTIILQYKYWVRKYPQSKVIPFIIGKNLVENLQPGGEWFLNVALQKDSTLAEAWFLCYANAKYKGESTQKKKYFLRKAICFDKNNKDYYLEYISLFEEEDLDHWRLLCLNYLTKYPHDKNIPRVISSLAHSYVNTNDKKAYYEYLRANYQLLKGNLAISVLNDYYSLVVVDDPAFGVSIAQLYKDSARIAYAQKLLDVRKLVEKGRIDSAYTLSTFLIERFGAGEKLVLYKARIADLAGHTIQAYNLLFQKLIMLPSDSLHADLIEYGKKINLDKRIIDAKLKEKRATSSQLATDFSLVNVLNGQKVSLSNFKNKVILLTYWFPQCLPCRAEFTHFEKVLKKIDSKKVVYLALDILATPNEYVRPFIRSSGYSFIPLQDTKDRKKGNMPSPGAPTNYLIDGKGRIVFSNFRIDESNERTLELMILDLVKEIE